MSDRRPLPQPNTEVEMPQFAASGPRASQIADFASMAMDLDHVAAACEWLRSQLATGEASASDLTESLVHRSVWESAVISYGRCFTSGRGHLTGGSRSRMPDELMDELTDSQRSFHDQIVDERNTHVGHRVDPDGQQARVLVLLNAPYNPPAVAGVGPLIVHRLIGNDWPEHLTSLARQLADRLHSTIEKLSSELRTELAEDLPAAYATARPSYPMVIERNSGRLFWGEPIPSDSDGDDAPNGHLSTQPDRDPG